MRMSWVFISHQKDRVCARICDYAVGVSYLEILRRVGSSIDDGKRAGIGMGNIDLIRGLIHGQRVGKTRCCDGGDHRIAGAIDDAHGSAAIVGDINPVGSSIQSDGDRLAPTSTIRVAPVVASITVTEPAPSFAA